MSEKELRSSRGALRKAETFVIIQNFQYRPTFVTFEKNKKMSSFIDFGLAQKQYNRMNKITQLFNIKYPIVQGGMIWHSGWRLASAVSNNGGLG